MRNYVTFFPHGSIDLQECCIDEAEAAEILARLAFFKDAALYRNFFQQAHRGNSFHDIEDYSLNEAYRPHGERWLKTAREQIDLADIVIVALGDDTNNAPGVICVILF